MNISLGAFLRGVQTIADSKPRYQAGHDGSDGACDCIGLVIGAVRRAGGSWKGIHGSNYAARNEMAALLPLTCEDELSLGELVFKAAAPGTSAYSLPHRYAHDADQQDYYHVGVVTGVNPLEITHCTGPGILRDTRLGQWSFHGFLAHITQEGEKAMPETARVTAPSGSTVNLRRQPNGSLMSRLPVGATVTVLTRQEGWVQVQYQQQTGWVMESFVAAGDCDCTLSLPREAASILLTALTAALGGDDHE